MISRLWTCIFIVYTYVYVCLFIHTHIVKGLFPSINPSITSTFSFSFKFIYLFFHILSWCLCFKLHEFSLIIVIIILFKKWKFGDMERFQQLATNWDYREACGTYLNKNSLAGELSPSPLGSWVRIRLIPEGLIWHLLPKNFT